jgi:hypothetical protein
MMPFMSYASARVQRVWSTDGIQPAGGVRPYRWTVWLHRADPERRDHRKIHPSRMRPGEVRTRQWDHTLKLRDGGDVYISGAEMLGGQVDVRFQPDGWG